MLRLFLYAVAATFFPHCHGMDDIFTGGLKAMDPEIDFEFELQGMDIDATIVDSIVKVSLSQVFSTSSTELTSPQCQYVLPLDEGAAVVEFRALVGSRVIEGVVKEREAARREYNEAVEQGKTAFLGEQNRPDIFAIAIGNIPSDTFVGVILSYVAPLTGVDARRLRWVLPTGIAPRYVPRDEGDVPPLAVGISVFSRGVAVQLRVYGEVVVSSETHTISPIDSAGDDQTFILNDADALERDLVVDLRYPILDDNEVSDLAPKVYIYTDNELNETAMLLSVVPSLPVVDSDSVGPIEFVLVIDLSGSMSNKIEATRSALQFILSSTLPAGSFFNLVFFGSTFDSLFPNSVAATSETLERARLRVSYLDATYGGTEILPPIRFVLSQPVHEEAVSRQVFVLTDAEVSNSDQLIEHIEDNRGGLTRVFGLGLGPHVGRNLVNGIARSGGGTAEFVLGSGRDEIADAVVRQMETATQPAATDIQVDWGVASIVRGTQAPFRPPPLFDGKRFLMYYLFPTNFADRPTNVVISALIGPLSDTRLERFNVSTIVEVKMDPELLHKMAARELIRDLEEGRSFLHVDDNEPSPEQVKTTIAEIGIRYQIPSSETSFVAVDNANWTSVTKDDELGEPYDSNGVYSDSAAGGLPARFLTLFSVFVALSCWLAPLI